MEKILATKLRLRTTLPVFAVVIALIIVGSISYAFSPKHQSDTAVTQKNVQKAKVLAASTHIQKPSLTPLSQKVSAQNNISSRITPSVQNSQQSTPQNSTSSSNNTTQTQQSNSNSSQQSQTSQIADPTVAPTQASQPTPTTVANTVSMQIQDPAGTSSFTVNLSSGANACDVLQEAKNEGKITSVTLDNSYMSTLHSSYVTEINGYQNNWTFTVNGSSPNGCSLINPKPNDSIVWKFG